jgi:hypothetical protein
MSNRKTKSSGSGNSSNSSGNQTISRMISSGSGNSSNSSGNQTSSRMISSDIKSSPTSSELRGCDPYSSPNLDRPSDSCDEQRWGDAAKAQGI